MSEHFSVTIYSKFTRANRRKHTCGSLRLRLHKPNVAISRLHYLQSQFSVVITHYILVAALFTYSEEMES